MSMCKSVLLHRKDIFSQTKGIGPEAQTYIYMMEIISKEVSLLIFRGDSHGILKGGQKNSDRFSNIGYILMGGNASGMQLHLKRIVFWSHLYPNAINQG